MMRREDVESFARRRPFQPFEIRLNDGQRFRMRSVEQFILGRHDIATLTRDGVIVHLSIGLISTIRPLGGRRARRA
jgi:hypothetical protein